MKRKHPCCLPKLLVQEQQPMDAQNDVNRGEFTWKISYFTEQDATKLYSEAFTVSGCKWRIVLYPKGNATNQNHLSLYLDVPDSETLPNGWTRDAESSLSVINQINNVPFFRAEMQHEFTARERSWGFPAFIPLTELQDRIGGYLANDILVIKAEVCILIVTPPMNIHPVRPTDKFDSYFTGLEKFVNAAEIRSAGSSSCSQDGALTAEIPSLEEVEKAKQSLKECLSDLFRFNMKEKLSEDNAEFELHKLQKDRRFSSMKKSQKTRFLYKQLMDDLVKEEEELKIKMEKVKSRRGKLLSDWEILLVESEKAKSGYKDEQKKVAEAKEKKRIAEERMSRSTTAWLNLKDQFS